MASVESVNNAGYPSLKDILKFTALTEDWYEVVVFRSCWNGDTYGPEEFEKFCHNGSITPKNSKEPEDVLVAY